MSSSPLAPMHRMWCGEAGYKGQQCPLRSVVVVLQRGLGQQPHALRQAARTQARLRPSKYVAFAHAVLNPFNTTKI